MKYVSVFIYLYVLLVETVLPSHAQATKVLKAAQINGVYRYSHNEFRIVALRHHKLKVQFKGQWRSTNNSRHTGDAIGEAIVRLNSLAWPTAGPGRFPNVLYVSAMSPPTS